MQDYAVFAVVLRWIVVLLLLLGTGRLCGQPLPLFRCVLGAMVDALYCGLCLHRHLLFLANPIWRTVCMAVVIVIAYGIHYSTMRIAALFIVLSLALQGIAPGWGDGGSVSVVLGIIDLGILCYFVFQGRRPGNIYVPVEISRGEVSLRLTALQDTGNMLRDPVTGQPVLVIGADAAAKLTGLTREQLRSPVESITAIPGLRLIPYRSVGRAEGLLLALKFHNVKIGGWRGNSLVAFAPEGLGSEDSYEALTGGVV